jgi:small conductance mechanosensitive channel
MQLFIFAQGGDPIKATDNSLDTANVADNAIEKILPEGSPEWLQMTVQHGIPYAMGAAKVILILFLTWIIAGMVSRVVTNGLKKAKFDETLLKFFAKLSRWSILLLGVLACLSIFGVETTSFAAVIGAAGLAIGLAFQGTLSNFASGIMLLIFRPFKVGQFVKVGGEAGTINEIDLFTTSLDTSDNRRVIIPNGSIFTSTIENVSHHVNRRIDIELGTAYEADLDQTRQVLEEVIERLEDKLDDHEHQVVLVELGGSSIHWQVRVWCSAEVYWNLKQELIRATKYALDEAGIGIPYPQMDVHLANAVS